MDFFDPEKQKRHAIRLYVGYALIGLALTLATTILLYHAYGFGIDRSGKVIQNGLVFLSSRPKGGDVYVDGKRYKSQTNTRMVIPAGQHKVRISRDGYRTWQRALTVEGGSVERFDYPFLIPAKLTASITKQYGEAPGLVSQSADRRWLLVGLAKEDHFDLFDLKADKPVAKPVAVPEDILSTGTTTGWAELRWADDNRHVILVRSYEKDAAASREYILFDRGDPAKSENLSRVLGFTPSALELQGGDYDRYYAYDQPNGTVFTATLKEPTPQLYLENVLNFTADEQTALYATAAGAPEGKVSIRIKKGDDPSYVLRTVPAGTAYLLDLAVYDGMPYVAAGAQSEGKVYVYQNPLATVKRKTANVPVPVQILKVPAPTLVQFSDNARFVMAENADYFAVYDAETDRGYSYQIKASHDIPGAHAKWVDGYHLDVVSGGKVRLFDFDGANTQTLVAANPAYRRVYSPDYGELYVITPQHVLAGTSLLTAKDR